MNKPLYKFYDLENLTQEKLNELALERNKFIEEIEKLKQTISEQQEQIEIYENQLLCLKGEENE